MVPDLPKDPMPELPSAPEIADASGGVPGGVPGGVLGGVPGGTLGGIVHAPPPPAPPVAAAPPKPAPPSRIFVGGDVQLGLLMRGVMPEYPTLASRARVAGTVRLKAVIGCDGKVKEFTLIGGHPLLIPAAETAVKQWVYKPTLLNGQPVEVDTVIEVNFIRRF